MAKLTTGTRAVAAAVVAAAAALLRCDDEAVAAVLAVRPRLPPTAPPRPPLARASAVLLSVGEPPIRSTRAGAELAGVLATAVAMQAAAVVEVSAPLVHGTDSSPPLGGDADSVDADAEVDADAGADASADADAATEGVTAHPSANGEAV